MAGLGRHGGGLAAARLIDADWSAHHRATAEQTLTARCQLHRRDGSENDSDGWSPTEGRRDRTAAAPLWEGPCRLQAEPTAAAQAEVAGQKIVSRTYRLSIPLDAPLPRSGAKADRFTLTVCPDDPAALGRPLRVVDVAVGSMTWLREVTLSDNLTGPTAGAGPRR